MRNQLTTRATRIPELVYAVEGQLDAQPVELSAWKHGRITLDMGICSLSLTAPAMIELIQHLCGAMDAVVEAAEGKQ